MTTFTYVARTRTESHEVTAPGLDFPDDGEPRPSQVSDQYWIQEMPPGRVGPTDGKWMLFYLNKDIDAAWRKAKSLFRKGDLFDCLFMYTFKCCVHSLVNYRSEQLPNGDLPCTSVWPGSID